MDLRDIALAAIRAVERENGIHVDLIGEDEVPPVPADVQGLQDVLEELIRNARDAGASRATIRVEARAGGGATVAVDNDYTTKQGPGRGHGLALARATLVRFGATLTLPDRARPRFVISLPGAP